jgi:hypothetical protein
VYTKSGIGLLPGPRYEDFVAVKFWAGVSQIRTLMGNVQASTMLYSSLVRPLTFTACTNVVHWGEERPLKNQVSAQTK